MNMVSNLPGLATNTLQQAQEAMQASVARKAESVKQSEGPSETPVAKAVFTAEEGQAPDLGASDKFAQALVETRMFVQDSIRMKQEQSTVAEWRRLDAVQKCKLFDASRQEMAVLSAIHGKREYAAEAETGQPLELRM